MSTTIAARRIDLSDGSVAPDAGHPLRLSSCLPAFAIGLTAPAAVTLAIEPAALLKLAYVLPGVLMPLFAVAIVIYSYCVLVPGQIAALSADPATRTLAIVEANAFARRRTALTFAEIVDVRMANAYDEDGYASRRAEVVLRSSETIALPAWIGEPEAVALHRIVRSGR